MSTSLLQLANVRGVKFDLYPDLAASGDSAKAEKLERILQRCRDHVDGQGRVHPRYYQSDAGRVMAQAPNLMLLPWSILRGDFGTHHNLTIGVPKESVFLAHLLGEPFLADGIISHGGVNPLLGHVFNIYEAAELRAYKEVFFRLCYGGDTGTCDMAALANILEAFPRLVKAPGRNRQPLLHHVFRLVAAMDFTVAQKAEAMPDCRLVGFAHDPIIEYVGDSPDVPTATLVEFTFDLLRFWSSNQDSGTHS